MRFKLNQHYVSIVRFAGYALHGHGSGVQAVAVVKERFLISASDDYDLRVHDFGATVASSIIFAST